MKNLNIIFAGTPEISAHVLNDLIDSSHKICAVLTQPDREKGRGRKIQYSPVKKIALDNNINIYQPVSFKKDPQVLDKIKELSPDVIVVIAYGLIVPKEFLEIPKYGCLNIHVSLLPKWRGAAPIQRAIQAGDKQTGLTIMRMDEGLDTGDILNTKIIDIADDDTSQIIHDKMSELAIEPLLEVLDNIDSVSAKKQSGKESYARKISKEEGLLDFSRSMFETSSHIRAFTPWPSSYFMLDDKLIKVGQFELVDEINNHNPGTIIAIDKHGFKIALNDGCIVFKELQFPGKKMMSVANIINGNDLTKYIGCELN